MNSLIKQPAAKPDWDLLFQTALAQEGNFTTGQAADAGYSSQLLAKYLANGKVVRVMRGIYRLVHFPAGEFEQLTVLWLWSACSGIFSHMTALSLHELSDALPSGIEMTLPVSWKIRRIKIPDGLTLSFADLTQRDVTFVGPIPVTSIQRTLSDCMAAKIQPEFLADARTQALERGLLSHDDLPELNEYLDQY